MTVWQWIGGGLAFFMLCWVLSVWQGADAECDGVVVHNFFGWPTCVERGE